ncbi:MAG TPA: hypothetical protein VFK43_11660, partial [Acidimicrobiales bacterium]|nr:hypothetical protein [Acidimicrobiales bacterium]
EHPAMDRSPAMSSAGRAALAAAGVGIDDVAHLDLYSCFASSVNLACDALGIDVRRDTRPLTVTGGLPFAGGPGSGYLLHSIASMADRLRSDPGSYGLVSGVGMHMTKHVFGVYSTTPGTVVEPAPQPEPDTVPITDSCTGPATVAAYSVVHARDGGPDWGLAVCDVPGGTRCYARVEGDGLLEEIEATEWVGAAVDVVAGDGGRNLIKG